MRPQPCHSETWKDSAGVMAIGCFQASFHVQLFATYGFSVDVKGDHVTLVPATTLMGTGHGEV